MTSHIQINGRCPICGNQLMGFEGLVMKYSIITNRWTLFHLKDCYDRIEDINIICGETKYQIEQVL
jgi:hypothetical protein